MNRKIDINSDLGESFGAYTIGADEQVLAQITSANIACGWHAGDPLVMEHTVRLAKKQAAAVGAHPGFPDLMGFGRRNMNVSTAEAAAYVKYQTGALAAFIRAAGMKMQHVKLHGAFYNMAAKDSELAKAVCEAVAQVDESLILLGPSGSCLISAARECGLRVACEVFADRAYQEDGSLMPRTMPGSVIRDENEALERVLRMVEEGTVVSASGAVIPLEVQSVCVHGDNPKALEFAGRIRRELESRGITVAPFGRFV